VSSTRHSPSQPSVLHLPLERFTARDGARYRLRIAISAYPTCIQRPVRGVPVGITFGMEKLEWCGYLVVKKKSEDTITRFYRIHERDRQTHTDTQTDTAWRHRPPLHSIARQKTSHLATQRCKPHDPTVTSFESRQTDGRTNTPPVAKPHSIIAEREKWVHKDWWYFIRFTRLRRNLKQFPEWQLYHNSPSDWTTRAEYVFYKRSRAVLVDHMTRDPRDHLTSWHSSHDMRANASRMYYIHPHSLRNSSKQENKQ